MKLKIAIFQIGKTWKASNERLRKWTAAAFPKLKPGDGFQAFRGEKKFARYLFEHKIKRVVFFDKESYPARWQLKYSGYWTEPIERDSVFEVQVVVIPESIKVMAHSLIGDIPGKKTRRGFNKAQAQFIQGNPA